MDFKGRISMQRSFSVQLRTFNIERTIIIFSFCKRLVTKLNESALGVLRLHCITKKTREILIGISRFLTGNLLNQLLCYTNIKGNCLFVAECVESLNLND